MIDRSKTTINLSVVLEAIEMASDSSTAYYDLETNGIVWYMDPVVFGEDEENEALGELIEEGWKTRFFELPSQFDIHEYGMMENFIYEEIPVGAIQDYFESLIRGRGAFRRFKDQLRKLGIEQEWYDYQEKAQKRLAIEWCEDHGFNYEE